MESIEKQFKDQLYEQFIRGQLHRQLNNQLDRGLYWQLHDQFIRGQLDRLFYQQLDRGLNRPFYRQFNRQLKRELNEIN